jgi:hypothetical protein
VGPMPGWWVGEGRGGLKLNSPGTMLLITHTESTLKVLHVLGTSAFSELVNSPMCTKYGYARRIYYISL